MDPVTSLSANCDLNVNVSVLISSLQNEFQKPAEKRNISPIFSSFQFNLEEWKNYEHYSTERYVRNLVAVDDNFSLLLICWEQGQETPIHDHGATNCWMRVVEGTLNLHLYEKEDGKEVEKETLEVTTNRCRYFESLGYHKTSNRTQGRAMSLHLYSPPYLNCCFKAGEELEHKAQESFVPVVYCTSSKENLQRRQELRHTLKLQHKIFTNFSKFVEVLKKELETNGDDIEYMIDVISKFNFNPKEWRRYIHFEKARYTRNLVGYDDKFTLLLLCWDKGQASPIHDHAGSSCWVKMLEGELVETRYEPSEGNRPKVVKRTVMTMDSVAYIHDSIGIHKMENESQDSPAISLHIYSPPYTECTAFDPNSATRRKISMKCTNIPQSKKDYIEMKMTPELNPSMKLEEVSDVIQALTKEFSNMKTPSVTQIQALLDSIQFDPQKWRKFVHFNEHRWTRNLIAFDENFSLMLNCWNKKQGTPVHHHGNDGTVSWMKVVLGKMQVTNYCKKRTAQRGSDSSSFLSSSPTSSFLNEKRACGNYDLEEVGIVYETPETPATYMDGSEGLHKTENALDSPAISLHVFSPPYLECQSHDQEASFPVVYCNPSQYQCLQGDLGLNLQLQYAEAVYENFETLTKVLEYEFGKEIPPCSDKIKFILRSFQFNPKEWEQYALFNDNHYTRSLISSDANYSLCLVAWSEGQESPLHDHCKSRTWIKVLDGEIEESTYVNIGLSATRPQLRPLEVNLWTTDTVVFRDHNCTHKTKGVTKAVSLHLYSPPCVECTSYDLKTGEKIKFPVDGRGVTAK